MVLTRGSLDGRILDLEKLDTYLQMMSVLHYSAVMLGDECQVSGGEGGVRETKPTY